MDTKHEALELADFLERDHRNWHSRAPQVLRRQHARIEELERALQGCVGVAEGKRMAPGEGFLIINQARALLTKKD